MPEHESNRVLRRPSQSEIVETLRELCINKVKRCNDARDSIKSQKTITKLSLLKVLQASESRGVLSFSRAASEFQLLVFCHVKCQNVFIRLGLYLNNF